MLAVSKSPPVRASARTAELAPKDQGAPAGPATADGVWACPCGGGCPRCVPLYSPGRALDASMAGRLAAAYGHDFAAVHVDGPAAASAQALQAVAYTTSGHIVFAPGRYAPDTARGQRLIAHEAAHVVQQARAGRPQAGIAPHLRQTP